MPTVWKRTSRTIMELLCDLRITAEGGKKQWQQMNR